MKLTVRGKEFNISLVSNYVHEKYIELIALSVSLVDEVKFSDEAKKDKDIAKKEYKEIEAKRKDISSKIIEIRREMIRELVETNDIVYDASWWQKKTDPDDINAFLLSCLQKDLIETKGVKKN